MGCVHPAGILPIYDENEEIIGGRCPVCKRAAFVTDETLWERLTRWWRTR